MKFRKRKNILKREKAALVRGEKSTLIQEKGHPPGKIDIKIFSASKYTSAYPPINFLADCRENGVESIGENKKKTDDNQDAPKKNMPTWQELLSTADLSVRAANVLLNNFSSCDEFLLCNVNSLRDLRNCGQKTIIELAEFRESIIAVGCRTTTHEQKIQNRLLHAEDLLKFPPSEENLMFLPIFNSGELVNFSWNDLHPGFKGSVSLSGFVFSVRASKILKGLGLTTIGEVMVYPSGNLLTQKNFGRKCLKEVQNIIRSFVVSGDLPLASYTAQTDSGLLPAIDYSSYENLVVSFVRHCLKIKRNQEIVCSRLNFPDTMPTLEQLGSQFCITRERVRQILKRANSLLVVKAHRDLLSDFWEIIEQIIIGGGGIISLVELAVALQTRFEWTHTPNPSALGQLLAIWQTGMTFASASDQLSVDTPCLSCHHPLELLSHLDLSEHDSYHFEVVGNKILTYCKDHCDRNSIQKFHKAFIKQIVSAANSKFIFHDDVVFPSDRWLIRHGERLEDLIVHVLENHGKPIHFSEIGAAIRKENIKYREISDHNVHAAMMRYDTVEIVQRGIYGLKAWGVGGYRSVSTAIEDLLNAHDLPMRRSEIIKHLAGEYSEQNISAALHNCSNRFVSIGEGFYDQPERWRKRSLSGLIDLLPDALVNLARFITTNNNCSYKLVLALVFIRGMDEKGVFYLPTLKERFFNFYLGRQKKGELVEAAAVLMRRIGELGDNEIKNKAIKRPLESFLASGLWSQKYSSFYLHEDLVELLANAAVHSLLLIILLKGIDEYFTAIILPSSNYSKTSIGMDTRTGEPPPCLSDDSEEEIMNVSSESTLSITLKKKSWGKIPL
ncbi:MAG: hypothetical protein KKA54_14725 [Proteobacteria bacterium]|nr:hypothetical protein [Pseudomonadota bacterium]